MNVRVKIEWIDVYFVYVLLVIVLMVLTCYFKFAVVSAYIEDVIHVDGQRSAVIGIPLKNYAGTVVNITGINVTLTYKHHPLPTTVSIPGTARVYASSSLPITLFPGDKRVVRIKLPVANDEISLINVSMTLVDEDGVEKTINTAGPTFELSFYRILFNLILMWMVVVIALFMILRIREALIAFALLWTFILALCIFH